MRSTNHPLDERSVELVPVHDASCCVRSLVDRIPASLVCVAGLAGLIGLAWLIASLPVTSFWTIGAAIGGLIAITSIPWPRRGSWAIGPEAIADREVSSAYRALLTAHAQLATVLSEKDASTWARNIIDRSRDTVVLCGRIAWTTNHAYRYLSLHDPETALAEEARLRQREADTSDVETAHSFAAAAAARSRQLATVHDIRCMRDRVLGRLELATSSLYAMAASITKSQTIDDESLALADASVAEQVDGLNDEVDALVSATASCAA